jgi:hypothetical protein
VCIALVGLFTNESTFLDWDVVYQACKLAVEQAVSNEDGYFRLPHERPFAQAKQHYNTKDWGVFRESITCQLFDEELVPFRQSIHTLSSS